MSSMTDFLLNAYRKMSQNMAGLAYPMVWRYDNFVRASGDVECPSCGLPYREHPELEPTFHLLCNGRVVKL